MSAITADYERLVEVMQSQLDVLTETQAEDKFKQFNTLALEWSLISQRIEQLLDGVGGYDNISPHIQTPIRDAMLKMKQLAEEIEKLLAEHRKNDSETMLRVKMKQTTLRSYGGVGVGDSVPLYFDERK